jgi:nitrogenase molybdenum-iron protein NifN
VAVASGGNTGRLRAALEAALEPEARPELEVLDDSDFFDLESSLADRPLDLLVGSSKGYKLAHARGVPLVRVGFPIHDRFGGARVRLLGYGGALELFDRIVNVVLEHRQRANPVGYTYY